MENGSNNILPFASLGLSLNLDTLESWQVFRQRSNNYISNNIPILSSGVGIDASIKNKQGIISINDYGASYKNALKYIEDNPEFFEEKKQECKLSSYTDYVTSQEKRSLLEILKNAKNNKKMRYLRNRAATIIDYYASLKSY